MELTINVLYVKNPVILPKIVKQQKQANPKLFTQQRKTIEVQMVGKQTILTRRMSRMSQMSQMKRMMIVVLDVGDTGTMLHRAMLQNI